MKMIGIREARTNLSGLVAQAQRERVVLTRHGRPAALVIGLEGEDLEEVLLKSDKAFWRDLAQRRKTNRTISSEEMRSRLGMRAKAGRRRR